MESENLNKAILIKDALKLVDNLAKLDVNDADDKEEIEELIEKAKKIKRNRLWKLN